MSAHSPAHVRPGRPAPHAGRPGIATLLRLVSWLLAASVFAQPLLAGLFLDGHTAWRDWHAANGMLLLPLLGLTQLVLAVLARRTGRSPGWLPLASLALFLAIVAQNLLGMSGQLALHLPLGVALVGLAGTLLVHARRVT